MKNLFPQFAKLVAVAACALTLGSCNRAEYAMLPKGSSYHGVTRVAAPVPASPAPVAVEATTPATEAAKVDAPVATPASTTVLPATSDKKTAQVTPAVVDTKKLGNAATAATPAPKLNLVQRVALNKVARKMDKMMQKSGTANPHANTASTQRLDSDLRTAILLAAIGILVEILGIALSSSLVYILGAVLIIVGAVFFVLWLVNKL
jgi:hypothetical protein